MNLDEKLRWRAQLERLGVDIIEAGFPIASDGDFEAVKAMAAEVRQARIAGLARASFEDIDRAWQAVRHAERPRIHVFLATSDIHLQYKLRMTREQMPGAGGRGGAHARSLCPDVEFSPEDATRTEIEYLVRGHRGGGSGRARPRSTCRTRWATPSRAEMRRIITRCAERVPKHRRRGDLSVHCHNDLGLAVANSWPAIDAGARQVECTINGIGERAGNAALEEIVMAMHVRARPDALRHRHPHRAALSHQPAADRNHRRGGAAPTRPSSAATPLPTKPAFIRTACIKNPLTYEIMTPQSVGVPRKQAGAGQALRPARAGPEVPAIGI